MIFSLKFNFPLRLCDFRNRPFINYRYLSCDQADMGSGGIRWYVRINRRGLRYFFYTSSVSYSNICRLCPFLHHHSLLWLPILLLSIRVHPETTTCACGQGIPRVAGRSQETGEVIYVFRKKKKKWFGEKKRKWLGEKKRKYKIFKRGLRDGRWPFGTYAIGRFHCL